MKDAKIVSKIPQSVLKIRNDAARRQRNVLPLTWKPFAALSKVKLPKGK